MEPQKWGFGSDDFPFQTSAFLGEPCYFSGEKTLKKQLLSLILIVIFAELPLVWRRKKKRGKILEFEGLLTFHLCCKLLRLRVLDTAGTQCHGGLVQMIFLFNSHRIHVWYIHLHLLSTSTKCR